MEKRRMKKEGGREGGKEGKRDGEEGAGNTGKGREFRGSGEEGAGNTDRRRERQRTCCSHLLPKAQNSGMFWSSGGVLEFWRGCPGVLAMPWLIHGEPDEGSFYVGTYEDAVGWAADHARSIINCADVDYPWAESCRRRWLNINFRGELNGRSWNQRMRAVLQFLLESLARRECVLLHCYVGRHRSGMFAVLALMFMLGLTWDKACIVQVENCKELGRPARHIPRFSP